MVRIHRVSDVQARRSQDSAVSDAIASLTPRTNKTASVSVAPTEAQIIKMAKDAGFNLRRVAGNAYENPATRDFWEVKNGKLVCLTGSKEVDDGESLQPADTDDPESTVTSIMADLEF